MEDESQQRFTGGAVEKSEAKSSLQPSMDGRPSRPALGGKEGRKFLLVIDS